MNIGLRSIRRRQRSLARGVLALFCAAWLQAAIVPCVAAHTVEPAAGATAPGSAHAHDGQDSHPGHDHDGTTASPGEHAAGQPCLYCPPGATGENSCDGHGGCAFPHDPQVDARAGGALFVAMPLSYVAPSPSARVLAVRGDAAAPSVVPRISLSVSYCRFIE